MSQSVERRTFLKSAALAAASLPFVGSLSFAQEAKESAKDDKDKKVKPSLVVIYLRGGIDALNAIVPYKDEYYREIRPTIAIGEEESEGGVPGVVKIDKKFGLHPSLAALKPYFDEKRAVAITCVGSPHPTRSHFDAQDFMEYGAPGLRTIRDGWLNRFLEETKKRKETEGEDYERKLRALAMQSLLPRSLRGSYPVLAVPDRDVLENDAVMDLFKDIYGESGDDKKKEDNNTTGKNMGGAKDEKKDDAKKDGESSSESKEMGEKGDMENMGGREDNTGDPSERKEEDAVVKTGKDTIKTLERFKEITKRDLQIKRPEYPAGNVGQRLRAIATVLHTGEPLEVAAIDVGGWDTHANQGGAVGAYADRLKNVADSIAAFHEDLGDKSKNTIVMVMSEFGRTCRENGNNGTDHGHGGCMFLVGGKLKSGEVYGEMPTLETKNMYQGRDLPVTTDFRDVFYTVLWKHMKFKAPKDFFPDYEKPSYIRDFF